jgi:hypothetical protein
VREPGFDCSNREVSIQAIVHCEKLLGFQKLVFKICRYKLRSKVTYFLENLF